MATYEKRVIGRLIRYYRLQKNLSSNSLLIMSNGSAICSVKTLRKIEQGYPLKDHYYDYLAIQLGQRYRLSHDDLMLLNQYREELYSCLCHFSKSSMLDLLDRLEYSVKEYDGILYFHESFSLYCDILRYHLYNIPPDIQHILFYNDIKDIMEGEDHRLILYYLYQFSNICPTLNRQKIMDDCLSYIEDPLFLNCKIINIYNHDSKFTAYEKIGALFMKTQHQLTCYHKIVFYNILAMLEINMNDAISAHQTLHKALDIIHNNPDFPDQLSASLHMRSAISSFAMEKYEEAVDSFLCSNLQRLNYNYLLLFNALEKTHKMTLLQKTLEDTKISYFNNILVQDIFRYFRIKHLQQLPLLKKHHTLEDFICQNLASKLKFSKLYQKVLIEEMINHISMTRNYKNLYLLLDILGYSHDSYLQHKHDNK